MTEIPDPAMIRASVQTSPNGHTPWEIAFHEAGHVIAEVALLRSVPDVCYLNDDPADITHEGRTISPLPPSTGGTAPASR